MKSSGFSTEYVSFFPFLPLYLPLPPERQSRIRDSLFLSLSLSLSLSLAEEDR